MDDFQITEDDTEQAPKKTITGKIEHDEVGQKFYIDYGDDEAVLAYTRVNDVLDVHHVFVPESMRGQGIAEKLAVAAFEFADANGLKIIASCPYIKDTFLEKHSEWNRIVAESYF